MTHAERIRQLSGPLEPKATGQEPLLQQLPGLRSVVFDIYGTLIISASGDIGLVDQSNQDQAMRAAFGAEGFGFGLDEKPSERFRELIRAHHARRRADGVEYPEVEIRDVWYDLAREFVSEPDNGLVEILAVEYECRTNPTWPMPGLELTLDRLKAFDLALGIVSNAQFYTPHLFPAHTGRDLEEFGFDDDLQIWSYQELEGKPSMRLYEKLAERLLKRGIAPEEVLYVGNDLRNDIWPAWRTGFRTALFAGDARSLRWREDDRRVAEVRPDLILTDLQQLLECVSPVSGS